MLLRPVVRASWLVRWGWLAAGASMALPGITVARGIASEGAIVVSPVTISGVTGFPVGGAPMIDDDRGAAIIEGHGVGPVTIAIIVSVTRPQGIVEAGVFFVAPGNLLTDVRSFAIDRDPVIIGGLRQEHGIRSGGLRCQNRWRGERRLFEEKG